MPTNSCMYFFTVMPSSILPAGYKVLLRYEGFGSDGSKDFWSNLLSEDVHNVGWCATYGKMLAPPKSKYIRPYLCLLGSIGIFLNNTSR